MGYFFSDAVTKARKHGYATLSEGEKWDWHADVYGFRRVILDVSFNENTSPCDVRGEWFDKDRAAIAERYYRAKYPDRNRQERAA